MIFEKDIEDLLLDNQGNRLSIAIMRGLHGIITELHQKEVQKKDKLITALTQDNTKLQAELDGFKEAGAPYQIDTRE